DGALLAFLVLLLLDEVLLAGVVVALGDLVIHPLDRLLFPPVRAGRAVERLGRPQRIVRQLDGGGTLGAEPAQRVWGVRVALDVDDLVVLRLDELSAAARAVRAGAREQRGEIPATALVVADDEGLVRAREVGTGIGEALHPDGAPGDVNGDDDVAILLNRVGEAHGGDAPSPLIPAPMAGMRMRAS